MITSLDNFMLAQGFKQEHDADPELARLSNRERRALLKKHVLESAQKGITPTVTREIDFWKRLFVAKSHVLYFIVEILKQPNAMTAIQYVGRPVWGVTNPVPITFGDYADFVNRKDLKKTQTLLDFIRDTVRLAVQPLAEFQQSDDEEDQYCQNRWLLIRLAIIINSVSHALPFPTRLREETASFFYSMALAEDEKPKDWKVCVKQGFPFEYGLWEMYHFLTMLEYNEVVNTEYLNQTYHVPPAPPLTEEEKDRLVSQCRLTFVFTKIPLRHTMSSTIFRLYQDLDRLVDKNEQLGHEIMLCCEYLLSNDRLPDDVAFSSKWFRECASPKTITELQRIGLKEYQAQLLQTPLNSVTVAGYLKALLKKYGEGLVPFFSKDFIIEAWQVAGDEDVVEADFVEGIGHLLCIDRDRANIIKAVCKVAKRILRKCTEDMITPSGLSRVLKVTSDEGIFDVTQLKAAVKASTQDDDESDTPASVQVNAAYAQWDKIWATILANVDSFILAPKLDREFESCLAILENLF